MFGEFFYCIECYCLALSFKLVSLEPLIWWISEDILYIYIGMRGERPKEPDAWAVDEHGIFSSWIVLVLVSVGFNLNFCCLPVGFVIMIYDSD